MLSSHNRRMNRDDIDVVARDNMRRYDRQILSIVCETDFNEGAGGIDMRVKRAVAGLTAVIIAVLGLSLGSAVPALGYPLSGKWRAYGNVNPISSSSDSWSCNGSKTVVPNVFAQVCVIRNSAGVSVRAAVIVRNNRPDLYYASAWMDLAVGNLFIHDWECSSSGVATHSWSVCFGDVYTQLNTVNSTGSANGKGLDTAWG